MSVKREKYVKIFLDEVVRTRNIGFLRTHRFSNEDIEVYLKATYARIDDLIKHRDDERSVRIPPNQHSSIVLLHQFMQKLPGLSLPEIQRAHISQQLSTLKSIGLIYFDGGVDGRRRLSGACQYLWSLFQIIEKTISEDIANVQDQIVNCFETRGFAAPEEELLMGEVEAMESQLFAICQSYVELQNQIA